MLSIVPIVFIAFLAHKNSQNRKENVAVQQSGIQTKIFSSKNSQPQVQVTVSSTNIAASTTATTMTMNATASDINTDQAGETTFKDIFPNTDAVYKTIKNGIKEDIVLHEKPTASPVYNFSIETNGLSIQFFEGQYYFFDQQGYAKLTVPKPFMVDANGVRSEQVSVSIDKKGRKYVSAVVPDFEWLSAPERKYPVKIDPSIVVPNKNLREMTDQRTISAKTYSLGGNKYASTSGLEAIHYKDENGKWQEISTAIVPSNDPEYDYMNITNNFQVFFSTDGFGNKKAVKFQVGDAWMKFNLVGGSGQGKTDALDESVFNFDEVYKEGTKTMDAKYTLSDTKLLEEVVLNQFQGYPELMQEIELHNAYLKKVENRVIAYRRADDGTKTEELLWIIPEPVMYEVGDPEVRNFGLHYEIENVDENTVVLSKVIDQEGKEWLSDTGRTYPLVIDTTAGPNSPGSVTEVSSGGVTQAWVNVNNILTDNSSYATFYGVTRTHFAKTVGYNFSIPANAVVNGVTIEAKKRASVDDPGNIGYITDSVVKLVKTDSVVGNDKAQTAHWSTTLSYVLYGASNDLWGITLEPPDVNATTFGNAFSGHSCPVDGSPIGYVDHIRMTVYYTESGPPPAPAMQFNRVKMNKVKIY